MSAEFCVQAIISLGAVVAMWLRLERRLTRVEDRVQERYRDKKAVNERIDTIEKWLPPREGHQ